MSDTQYRDARICLAIDGAECGKCWRCRGIKSEATVEQLQSELAALKESQRWVPVGERLPEIGSNFLVYDKYYAGHEDFSCIRFGRMSKSWGIAAQGENGANDTITHWKPPPTPPVDGDE